jgi:hypothetical protein
MELELTEYNRRSFPVKVAEVTFKNVDAVAKWCKGKVDTETTKILGGAETELPVVKLQGQGEDKGKELIARLGYFVVESKNRFRVYKAPQFHAAFEAKIEEGFEITKGEHPLNGEEALVEHKTSISEEEREDAEHHDNSSIDGQETVMVNLGGQNLL